MALAESNYGGELDDPLDRPEFFDNQMRDMDDLAEEAVERLAMEAIEKEEALEDF